MKSETVRITEFDPNLKSGRLVYDRGTYFAYSEDGVFYFPDEWASDVPTVLEPLLEGSRRTVSVSAVERNSAARALCLEHYGLDCQVCGMNFGETFGELGEGFIHVHHVSPLSETRAERRVDPIEDLVPVCPNCHAMLHREVPPLSVNDLRSILNKPGIRS
nr:HNH endonuclease [Maritimibacter dapengensis]